MPTDETQPSAAALMATALMDMKDSFDQLRFHTNGVRQGYIEDGYTPEEASAMATTDHRWLMEMMVTNLRQQGEQEQKP